MTRRDVLGRRGGLGLAAAAPGVARAAAPRGAADLGLHVSLAPTWFDPAETQGIITPYMVLYALHDAMVKDMPGKPQAPCLAEVVVDLRGPPDPRIRAAPGRQVP